MNAGRELDALVAEKVMGWTWDENTAWSPTGSRNARVADGDLWWWLPPYSTDIAAAWEVVERIRERWELTIDSSHRDPFNEYSLEWTIDLREHYLSTIPDIPCFSSASLPHLVCLVALALPACDQEQEHEPRHD